MVIEFFLPMKKIPTVTHQEQQVTVRKGRPKFYKPQELLDAKNKYMSLLWPYAPDEQIEGKPIRLITKWIFFRNIPIVSWKTTKPDTDNMIKLFKDCLTECGFWKDDALVCSEITEKFWSPFEEKCGIWVRIEELDEVFSRAKKM